MLTITVDAYQMWDVRKLPSDDHGWYIEGSCGKIMYFLYDDGVMIIYDEYGGFTYIWYDANGFVLLSGDMTYD